MKKLSHRRARAGVRQRRRAAGRLQDRRRMQEQSTGSVPNDYRQRHPIAVREKAQTLTVFIGDRPRRPDAGAARRSRRARLELAAGSDRRHRDRDAGRRGQRARRGERLARDPRDPRARRRAAPFDRDPALSHRRIRSGSAPSASTIRRWRPRPARAGCGPTISARPTTRSTGRTGRTGITAAPTSAISPRRSTTRPISCSRAPKRRC